MRVNRTPVTWEAPLPPPQYPAHEIYAGYEDIMETRNYRGDEQVNAQLQARYGIKAWAWTRLKIVFEASRMGDEYAKELIARTDRGELTYSGAYRLLRKRDADEEIIGSMTSVSLQELYNRVIGAESYFHTIEVALRRGLPTRVGKLTEEQIGELPALARSTSTKLKKIATHLRPPTTGGLNTDGSDSQHDRQHDSHEEP
jgi:hypothetical protein